MTCDPKNCLVDSPDFIQRLERIEYEMEESKRLRHDRNTRFTEVMDQMRVEQHDDKDRIDRIERAVEKILGAIEGSMGFSGIVTTQIAQGKALNELNGWRVQTKAYFVGALSVFTIISGIIQWIITNK